MVDKKKEKAQLSHQETPEQSGKKQSARDLVNLTHVETQKQKVDRESLADLMNLQQDVDSQQVGLDQEDHIILGAFEKKRLMLERVWIIVNEARVQMGMEPIKQSDIKVKLDALVDNGYLTHEEVEYDNQTNDVYILTDKGKDEIL
jgi:DNA-binding MarR family transcriptional regulator